jgi:ATP-dependent Clp protease protease subunit
MLVIPTSKKLYNHFDLLNIFKGEFFMFRLDTSVPEPTVKGHPTKELVVQEPKVLEVTYNRIYFYSEIDRGSVLTLNKNLRYMANEHISQAQILGLDKPAPIWLHISSGGGNVFPGLAAMDEILAVSKMGVEVRTIVDGCAASAATFLSIVGTRRYINQHAYMLIHQLSNEVWGKFEEFVDEMENMMKLMDMVRGLYREKTKLPEDQIKEILKHDLWWSAQECLEYGLVDEII